MAALRLVGSSKISLLAVYCFVIVATRYISSVKGSPVPQDAGEFQKPHFQVMKTFSTFSDIRFCDSRVREIGHDSTFDCHLWIFPDFFLV